MAQASASIDIAAPPDQVWRMAWARAYESAADRRIEWSVRK
jgi:hypothetical protein